MRHKPVDYNGLTIVLSVPSRKDSKKLLTGFAGDFFQKAFKFLRLMDSDIRTSSTRKEGLLPETKAVFLLGEKAMHEWAEQRYQNYTLNEQRGCPLDNPFKLPMLASYTPQDAVDPKNFEGKLNPHLKGTRYGLEEKETEEDEASTKRKGNTQRRNFNFWLRQDTRKIESYFRKDSFYEEPADEEVIIRPASQKIIESLRNHKNCDLHLDLETDEEQQIRCFGFSFNEEPTIVVPCFDYRYEYCYRNLPVIFGALGIALSRNRVVVHNGAGFDLFWLVHKYKLPVSRSIYDTMLSHFRCFPGVEKSLGHCMSLYTYEQYHKDEGIFCPQNHKQDQTLWNYNAKDVHGMKKVKRAQERYSQTVQGLSASITQVNESIRPYLITTLFGIRYSKSRLERVMKENDKKMTQLLRILKILIGHEFLPTSPKQVGEYLFDEMGYKVTGATKTGKRKVDEITLQQTTLKHTSNPVMKICIMFRELKKETGILKWKPWKEEDETALI